MKVVLFLFITAIGLAGCHSAQQQSRNEPDIAWGPPQNGLVCGIQLATKTPLCLNVFVKNVGTNNNTFTIKDIHYSSWADIYVDGNHYYPAPTTLTAARAVGPRVINVEPGQTIELPRCSFSCPIGTHKVLLKYWLNRSPMVSEPTTYPYFESGAITVTVQDGMNEGSG